MKKNNIPIIKKKNGYNTPTGKNKNLSITKSKKYHMSISVKDNNLSTVKETQQPKTTNPLFYLHDETTDTASNIKHSYTFIF